MTAGGGLRQLPGLTETFENAALVLCYGNLCLIGSPLPFILVNLFLVTNFYPPVEKGYLYISCYAIIIPLDFANHSVKTLY